jgi:hypothetical protein
MKNIFLLSLMLACVFGYAQQKLIIKKSENITKSIDDKGNVTTKIIEQSDSEDEVDKVMEMMNDLSKDGEYLSVDKSINNGKETTSYTLTTIKGGQKNVMVWDGNGPIPEAIKNKMKNVNINSNIDNGISTITVTSDANEVDNPRRKKMKSKKMYFADRVEQERGSSDRKRGGRGAERASRENGENKNKTKLGIMLNDEGKGVTVEEVFKGSIADKAGIEKGDIILKLKDEYIFSANQLMMNVRKLNEGDKVNIVVIRNKTEKKLEANI